MQRYVIHLLFFILPLTASSQQAVVTKTDSLISAGSYEIAAQFIRSSLGTVNPRTRATLNSRSIEILIHQGKLGEAEQLIAGAKSVNDPFEAATLKTSAGFLYLNMGRNDRALELLTAAVHDLTELENGLETAQALSYLGQVYVATGKYVQAEAQLQMALSIRRSKLEETNELIAASYNDLGFACTQVDVDRALDYYEQAAAIYEKLHGKDHRKMAIANTNLGIANLGLQFYGDATNYFESALAIWEKIYPNPHPSKAIVLINLGRTYASMKNSQAALGYYQKALEMYIASEGKKHPDVAYTYNLIGNVLNAEGKFDEALKNYQRALIANVSDFDSEDINRNPARKNYYNANVMLYSILYKAQSLEARHYGKTLKLDDLRSGLHCLQLCDSLIDDIRHQSSDAADKIGLAIQANEVYEDGVRIAHAISEITFDSRTYRHTAFYFAEKSKSAVLQESIAEADAKSFAGIPAELLDREHDLKASIALSSQKLSQKPGEDEERSLRANLFASTRQYDDFIRQLEKSYPEYYNLKFSQSTPSVSSLQKMLEPGTAIISYFVADKNPTNQRLYTFVITRSSFRAFNSTLPDNFDRIVRGFNNSLYYSVPEAYRMSSNILSKLLLRGVPSTKELVIIPSGRLGTMPFEALTTSRVPEDFQFSSQPYLVSKSGISYEFSAGVLLQKSKSASPSQPSIFLCAPITFPEKDNLSDLPGTEKEVNNIAQLFASNSLIAKRTDANEGLVKSGKLADYRYLHFATHGVVDEVSPELSRIFLQPATSEDGNVFSGEIFNLKLNADLAVLSACQTGLGKFSKGEGVIGLSRALVYAGARSIIVSYWSVADESTSELMTDFYQRLLKQSKPDFRIALQESKLEMIKRGKYAAPYYWAPFVLIGF